MSIIRKGPNFPFASSHDERKRNEKSANKRRNWKTYSSFSSQGWNVSLAKEPVFCNSCSTLISYHEEKYMNEVGNEGCQHTQIAPENTLQKGNEIAFSLRAYHFGLGWLEESWQQIWNTKFVDFHNFDLITTIEIRDQSRIYFEASLDVSILVLRFDDINLLVTEKKGQRLCEIFPLSRGIMCQNFVSLGRACPMNLVHNLVQWPWLTNIMPKLQHRQSPE